MRNNSETRTAIRLSLLYMVGAGLWILFSDRLLNLFISDPRQLTAWQTTKGWMFVVVTTLLLYFLLDRELQKRGRIEAALQQAHTELEQRVEERTQALTTLADQLETLLTVQQAITRRLDPEDVLQLIAAEARRLTATCVSMVYLLEEDTLRVAAFSGDPGPDMAVGYRVPVARSGAGLSIRSGQPVLVHDAQHDSRLYGDDIRRLDVHSYMTVPLISTTQSIGVIAVADKLNGQLDANDERLVISLAGGAVIALENAHLYRAEQKRRRDLEALYHADEELYRYLHTDQVLQSLVDVAIDMLQGDKSAALVWDAGRERLVVHTARGFHLEDFDRMTFSLNEGLVGRAAANGELVVVEDARHNPRVTRRIIDAEGICSFIHIPIKIKRRIFGVFNISYTQPRLFDFEDQRLFTALGQRAALAIENARLYEQAQKTAALEERQRLARDLHDAVTQNLFSTTLITEVLPAIWENNPDEGRRLLRDLRLLSRGALAEMRTLLLELRPAALATANLSDLLRQLADAVMGRKGIPVAVTVKGECVLPTDVRRALYRLAQEALNNIAKHARAAQATVYLRCTPASRPDARGEQRSSVDLHISDDGRGFDPSRVSSEHLGLAIMRERAEAIGAGLEIDSAPGAGTQVRVCWKKVR